MNQDEKRAALNVERLDQWAQDLTERGFDVLFVVGSRMTADEYELRVLAPKRMDDDLIIAILAASLKKLRAGDYER